MPRRTKWWLLPSALVLILALPAVALAAPAAPSAATLASGGAVFTMTNSAHGNQVWAYDVGTGGALIPAGHFNTHGVGTGVSLADQGALALSANHEWLFVVNAGSNSVTAFWVNTTPLASPILTFADKISSHGVMPVSLTVHGSWLYVVNVGNATIAGDIAGFWVSSTGGLSPIAGSARSLSTSGATGAAEIAFNPAGTALAVTEKGTSVIDTYAVSSSGAASPPITTVSNGSTPYGFAFTPAGAAVVSDAGPGALSSYAVNHLGAVTLVSGSVLDNQSAPCWVVIADGGRVALTTNAHSNSISTYTVTRGGTLTLSASVGATTAASPTDMAMGGPLGGELFVLDVGAGEIQEFGVGAHGALTLAYGVSALPATAEGLAAF
ncbi:MAG: lactonase family protein [Thermoplasmata archaeon]|nr:lactonase family protein [Thermoplasmata archaeon]